MLAETLRQNLVDLAAMYGGHIKASDRTVGKLVINDNTFFVRIANGTGFTVKTYDKVISWFSTNWPDDLAWPSHIDRPHFKEAPAADAVEEARIAS